MGHVFLNNKAIAVQIYDINTVGTILSQLPDFYKISKDTIAVNIGMPSGEETEKNVQHIRNLGQECKISIKNIREKHRKKYKDHDNFNEKEIQKTVDQANTEVDRLVKNKIREIS